MVRLPADRFDDHGYLGHHPSDAATQRGYGARRQGYVGGNWDWREEERGRHKRELFTVIR